MKLSRVLPIVYHLAIKGAIQRSIALTTIDLGKELGVSQQTASRLLRQLEKLGFIKREVFKRGQYVILTDKSLELLSQVYVGLQKVFGELPETLTLEGEVFTGLGEGAFYVTRQGYRAQFIEKLGFDPFPGTLNLRIKSVNGVNTRRLLEHYRGIEIKGFSDGLRTYGPVKCFKAVINGRLNGALLLIKRSHYGPEVAEVIAPHNLREELNLRDGDLVRVQVHVKP